MNLLFINNNIVCDPHDLKKMKKNENLPLNYLSYPFIYGTLYIHIGFFFSIIRAVVKLHRRDQEVCCTSLDMLMKLLNCMEDEEDSLCSQEKQDGCNLLLYLVNAFW